MTTTAKPPLGNPAMVLPADWVPGPVQGRWTYTEYAALPDDGCRYEIVDGVLYMSPSPNPPHQGIVMMISHYLLVHVQFAGLGRVYPSPLDVELAPNLVFQPDVIVLLNANLEKVHQKRIVGTPDLVVEIASPSTSTHDRHRKHLAYARAAILEYWIVDPLARTVEVWVWKAGVYHALGIFEGEMTLPSQVVPDFPVHVEQFFL